MKLTKHVKGPFNLLRVAAVLLMAVVVTIQLLSGMLARYTTTASASDKARTAAFVFDVSDGTETQILDLSHIKKPGDRQEYTFTVQNKKGETVSEVAQNFTVTFTALGSLPLTYTYSCVQVENSETVIHAKAAGNTHSFENSFAPSAAGAYTYRVTVEWPKDSGKADSKYASGNGAAYLEIRIESEQID